MSERIHGFKAAWTAGFAALTALWGWYGWLVLLWVALMGLDVVTGMARAAKDGQWSSSVAREGLAAGETALLGPAVVVWYSLTECGSIVENAGALGAPVPGWLARRLERLRDRVDEKREDEGV